MSEVVAPKAVGIISLGCPKNLVDTEVMLGLLAQAGYRIVSDPEQADALIVNTCCFIEQAREEAAEALRESARWRCLGEGRVLICAGCWPQMDTSELQARFPEIDAYLGPGDLPNIAEIVARALAHTGPSQPESPPDAYLYDHTTPRLRATPPWTTYVKIAEGCRHACGFCVIPYLRGPYRSRTLDSIFAEARTLAKQGVQEINLIAQDTTAYGSDRGEDDISSLLTRLARIEGLHWIRLLYAFPTGITPQLIEVMADEPSICQYLDLPFQHAAGKVLKDMGRPGDGESYLDIIARLREAMPDIAVRSTFLVGYPGETDQDFQLLLDFLTAAQLDRVGAFCFSPERDTPAASLPHQIPADIARERLHLLMTHQQGISLERNSRWIGRKMEILLESRESSSRNWIGRSFRDAPEVDGTVRIIGLRGRVKLGDYVTVTITRAHPYDLEARPALTRSIPSRNNSGGSRAP